MTTAPNLDGSAVTALLDLLCPMHARLGPTGHILHAGPTLCKLRPGHRLEGMRFLEVMELRRPRGDGSMSALMAAAGRKLHLRLRDRPHTQLKGVLAPLPDGAGAVIDLSLGISVVEAVRDYALTSADFAATDLTIEMLYLVEAKSAAMEASRKLNLRLEGAKIAAEEQAFTDTLTGLKNRRALDCVLYRQLAGGRDFALLALDLDLFKGVNDRLGHAAGDHVLQEVARRMVEETRGDDMVARVGGDEFILILDGLADRTRLARIAARLITRLEEPIDFEGQTCVVSASIGAVLSGDCPAAPAAELKEAADRALYRAKNGGRGRHALHCRE
ncbi:GGDEF domain-containing protein [Roseovarius sp. TE539]|uniref:GGDEF domain-containing protein n=1 Tax=Roseovarius sp. TE539 TaxID=2249812 RepID=UPI000DE0D53B|nr:GGDEF domain-containing protein [Roseovarius sp. TE539]RBI74481.1 GGDEF domain-containing protein [Roseovarius sp. TE539]